MPWSTEPSFTHPRYLVAAATANGPTSGSAPHVYAIGGFDDSASGDPVNVVEAYDTAAKSWSTTAAIPNPLRQGFGAASIGGKLHIIGGFGESYTPLTATTFMTRLPTAGPRQRH